VQLNNELKIAADDKILIYVFFYLFIFLPNRKSDLLHAICYVFAWQGFDSEWAIGVASVRSC